MMSALSLETSIRIPWPRQRQGRNIVDTATDHGYLAIVCTKPAYPLCFLIGQQLSEGFNVLRVSAEQKRFLPISLMEAAAFFALRRQNVSNANAPQNLSTPRHISSVLG